MSTAARKARKRLDRWIREEGLDLPVGFRHPAKVGTPAEQRAENQPRGGVFDPLLPTGRSVRARRRIEARS